MDLDVLIEDARWASVDLERLAETAVRETLLWLAVDVAVAEISLLACDDARIAALNSDYRDKDGATNVLSWPAEALAAETAGAQPVPPQPDATGALMLGDIALAYETCACEAEDLNISLDDHTTHLIVHGVLHLLGYDHIRDPDATLMQSIESKILGKMGLNDPYKDYQAI